VKASTGKIGMGEVEERRSKERSREKEGREG